VTDDVAAEQLESLRRCLLRIETRTPATAALLLGLGEATAARMTKAVGFRNVAVHAYRALDWNIVHAIAVGHVGDFRDFMREFVRLAA
jgi:uncharacterized protein YutE (UPF0331/DUF86 family)